MTAESTAGRIPPVLSRRAVVVLLVALQLALLAVLPARHARAGAVAADNLVLGDRTYILTCDVYSEVADWAVSVQSEFGPDARLADFGDLATAASGRFTTLYDWLGAESPGLSIDGSQYWSGTRAYFLAAHTALPGGFAVHAYIAEDSSAVDAGVGVDYPRVNVGSWFFDRRLLVDVTDARPIPSASCEPWVGDDPVVDEVTDPDPVGASTPELRCAPEVVPVGGTVVCEVTGGDPGIEILWLASSGGAVLAGQGVLLDAAGAGTFSVRIVAGVGSEVMVELVEWNAVARVAVDLAAGQLVGSGSGDGQVPARVSAGLGPSTGPFPGSDGLALVTLLLGVAAWAAVRRGANVFAPSHGAAPSAVRLAAREYAADASAMFDDILARIDDLRGAPRR